MQTKSKTKTAINKCSKNFCKNIITRKAKKKGAFRKTCKFVKHLLKRIKIKKRFNTKKCEKRIESKIQELCVKTNCNPSCKDSPYLLENKHKKMIQNGFNKKITKQLKTQIIDLGAISGCYNEEELKKIDIFLKKKPKII